MLLYLNYPCRIQVTIIVIVLFSTVFVFNFSTCSNFPNKNEKKTSDEMKNHPIKKALFISTIEMWKLNKEGEGKERGGGREIIKILSLILSW